MRSHLSWRALGLLATALAFTIPVGRAAAGETIDGLWRTPTDHGLVNIAPCGAAVCGTLVSADAIKSDPEVKDLRNKNPALRTRMLKGVVLLKGFVGGPAKWTDGTIYDPATGEQYRGSMVVNAKGQIILTGCLAPLLCGSQTWTRDQ